MVVATLLTAHIAGNVTKLSYLWLRALALSAIFFLAPIGHAGQVWPRTADAWMPSDENGYSDFVRTIGRSGCTTPDECINSEANPLRAVDDPHIDFDADCADLIYMLRAYYAAKRGLPFTFANRVTALGPGGPRLSARGNRVVGRRTVRPGENLHRVLSEIRHSTSSAMFRIGPGTDDTAESDFYPVRIQRGSIRPGTAIYDPNGHVALVYDVGDDGRIHYMDSHPDFTLSRSVYGAQFGRDVPEFGAGFKNFRPFQLAAGRTAMARNAQIPDSSTEQYFGTRTAETDWRAAVFEFGGTETSYYEFVRLRMAKGRLTFNPAVELRETVKTLCNDLYDRQRFVERAIEARIDRREHPNRLPANIYAADDNVWETYSTPSRDARLKAAFLALRDDTLRLIARFNARDSRIRYSGLDLQADLLRAYDQAAQNCTVVYRNSVGRKTVLTFPDVLQRLFALSFNPYDCIERRWGAHTNEELATCANTPAKERWYRAQQGLRDSLDRNYAAQMGFTLQELEARTVQAPPPDVDVAAAIRSARIRPVADDSPRAPQ